MPSKRNVPYQDFAHSHFRDNFLTILTTSRIQESGKYQWDTENQTGGITIKKGIQAVKLQPLGCLLNRRISFKRPELHLHWDNAL